MKNVCPDLLTCGGTFGRLLRQGSSYLKLRYPVDPDHIGRTFTILRGYTVIDSRSGHLVNAPNVAVCGRCVAVHGCWMRLIRETGPVPQEVSSPTGWGGYKVRRIGRNRFALIDGSKRAEFVTRADLLARPFFPTEVSP